MFQKQKLPTTQRNVSQNGLNYLNISKNRNQISTLENVLIIQTDEFYRGRGDNLYLNFVM